MSAHAPSDPPSWTRQERRAHGPTALAAFICIAVSLWCIRAAPVLFYDDAVQYISLGAQLARGRGYGSSVLRFPDLMQPPLYPVLIALFTHLLGSPLRAAIVLCVAAQLLTVVALGLLHVELWGRRGRLVTMSIAAVYPNLAFGAALVLEPLFLVLLAWALHLGVTAARRHSPARAALCGLLLGLALLVRPEVVITGPVLAGLLLFWPTSLRRRLALLLPLGLCALVVALPYGLWMRSQVGVFDVLPKIRYNLVQADITAHMAWEPGEEALSGREQRTFFTLMPDHATFVMNHAFARPGFDPRQVFPRRPDKGDGGGVRALLAGTRTVLADAVLWTSAFHPLALLLLVLGVVRGIRIAVAGPASTGQRLIVAALGLLVALHLAPALLSGADYGSRFLAPSLLMSVLLVSGGAGLLGSWIARRRPHLHGPALTVVTALLLLGYGVGTARVMGTSNGGPRVMARSAALEQACARHIPAGSRLMAEHSRYAFLRGSAAFQLPYARTMEELLDYIAHHRIEYAIFDGRTLRRNPSRIDRDLADPRSWPRSWVPLERLFDGPDPSWIVRLR